MDSMNKFRNDVAVDWVDRPGRSALYTWHKPRSPSADAEAANPDGEGHSLGLEVDLMVEYRTESF